LTQQERYNVLLDALLTCKLRCGYIVNYSRTPENMKLEAEEMLRVIKAAIEPTPAEIAALSGDKSEAHRQRPTAREAIRMKCDRVIDVLQAMLAERPGARIAALSLLWDLQAMDGRGVLEERPL
jgi:hypothetical protein